MKRSVVLLAVSLFVGTTAACQQGVKRTFALGAVLGLLPGVYQEFVRSEYQGKTIASFGLAGIAAPTALLLYDSPGESNQQTKAESDAVDTPLAKLTSGTWGMCSGYFAGFVMGSLARVCAGYDTFADARASSLITILARSFVRGASERVGERAATYATDRVFRREG